MQETINKFWSRVNKDGPIPSHVPELGKCWEWTAGKFTNGYGSFRSLKAHRFSWELHNGEIVNDLFVLHKCDNKSCVNPSHLFLGTHQDNKDDCMAKGRNSNQEVGKTHCVNGHEFNEVNTLIYTRPSGKKERHCRICDRKRRAVNMFR